MAEKTTPRQLAHLTEQISFEDYQNLSLETDRNRLSGLKKREFPFLGLFGEVGTLLSALKKHQRDGNAYAQYEEAIIEEMGDVLWYLTNIASQADLKLDSLVREIEGFEKATSFTQLRNVELPGEIQFERFLLELATNVGQLFVVLSQSQFNVEVETLKPVWIRVFESLVRAANAASVDLGSTARLNLLKAFDRWPPTKERTALFDESRPFIERFPRHLQMDMFDVQGTPSPKQETPRPISHQHINGINIGRQLSDNKQIEDGYRFHDVFHLAFAVVLGWSPTLRSLLRVKRKSDKLIDDAEDGQRAGFLEEGLTALIFQHARSVNYFEGLTQVDYSLLKQIPYFVAEYEVKACALWEWEDAILQGFAVFRKIREKGRGSIVADFSSRSISYKPLRDGYPSDGQPVNYQSAY